MKISSSIALLLSSASFVLSQELATALSSYKQTSIFTSLISGDPQLITQLLTPQPRGYTILVPTDDAFSRYSQKHGVNVTSLTIPELTSILQYHILAANLTSGNFTQPLGITVPTLLTTEANNNRTAGAALIEQFGEQAAGQVLFISKDATQPAKFRVRQSQTISARGGLAESANLDAVDGSFAQGKFQLVDE
jgi:hypothetical protein